MIHHDFHTGNILLNIKEYDYDRSLSDDSIFISDMGLCGEVDNTDETKVYGVVPYLAPEVLRGNPYTQAADVYSFGMIMHFVATGRQPFANRAHDQYLELDICDGVRPEINKQEAPNCYIDLMKRCYDSNPENRPKATEIKEMITLFLDSYRYDMEVEKEQHYYEIEKQFIEAEEYRKSQLSFFDATIHPQAIYTCRSINTLISDRSEYVISDNNTNNTINSFKSDYTDCAIS
ncbi:kinase-like domain-containing protein, partial [Glomus cerebriforme]